MICDKNAVSYWKVQGKYRVGYSAFGTMVWAEEIVDTERKVVAEPPHSVLFADGRAVHYHFQSKWCNTSIIGQTPTVDTHKVHATTYEVLMACGHRLHNSRLYMDGREIVPSSNMPIQCAVCCHV